MTEPAVAAATADTNFWSQGASTLLRAYIESNIGFMREHPNYMVAIAEIRRNGLTADGEE